MEIGRLFDSPDGSVNVIASLPQANSIRWGHYAYFPNELRISMAALSVHPREQSPKKVLRWQ